MPEVQAFDLVSVVPVMTEATSANHVKLSRKWYYGPEIYGQVIKGAKIPWNVHKSADLISQRYGD